MILDTNAVSDFADANQRLLNCLQQSAADIHLPVIVLGEYRYGVKSSRLRAARESWLDELEGSAIVPPLLPKPVVSMLTSVTSSSRRRARRSFGCSTAPQNSSA
jgi:hypothetical protein